MGMFSPPTEPFGCASVTIRGLSAPAYGPQQVSLVWTEGSGPPYSVRFGSVPAPLDLGSQTGQPWNRQGISPYQSYVREMGEHVSPGSGLLTVKQTDLVLPGRGLDLEISRVFTTPRAFTWTNPST